MMLFGASVTVGLCSHLHHAMAFVLPTGLSSSSPPSSSSPSSSLSRLSLQSLNGDGSCSSKHDVPVLDDRAAPLRDRPVTEKVPSISAAFLSTMAAGAWTITAAGLPLPAARAYETTDYASETVQAAVQELQRGAGDIDATFKAYENIAGIITEGKGVGGMVNYRTCCCCCCCCF